VKFEKENELTMLSSPLLTIEGRSYKENLEDSLPHSQGKNKEAIVTEFTTVHGRQHG